MPKWTTYDEEDFYCQLHAGEIDFNNNPEFAPGDTLGLRESWSIQCYGQWVGDTARCVALCKIKKRIWEVTTPKVSCEIGMIQISFLHIMNNSGRIYSIIERCIHPKDFDT